MTENTNTENEGIGGPSALSAGLEGAYGGKALEILLAMARLAADGKSLTIAEDWGFGSATVIDQDGAHTHVGCDCAGSELTNFEAFVSQLYSLLVGKRGLSWVKSSNAKSQATDAALSRQVACTDGLCGNGSEVGAGDTAMKGKQ